jgi:peroxin-6
VPVRPSSALAHSTVQFSPSSLALQGFAEALQRVAPSKISSHSRSGIEIRVLDVIPLPLEAVFVTIEGELARRLENGEGTFHGEHARANGFTRGKSTPSMPEDRLTAALCLCPHTQSHMFLRHLLKLHCASLWDKGFSGHIPKS